MTAPVPSTLESRRMPNGHSFARVTFRSCGQISMMGGGRAGAYWILAPVCFVHKTPNNARSTVGKLGAYRWSRMLAYGLNYNNNGPLFRFDNDRCSRDRTWHTRKDFADYGLRGAIRPGQLRGGVLPVKILTYFLEVWVQISALTLPNDDFVTIILMTDLLILI